MRVPGLIWPSRLRRPNWPAPPAISERAVRAEPKAAPASACAAPSEAPAASSKPVPTRPSPAPPSTSMSSSRARWTFVGQRPVAGAVASPGGDRRPGRLDRGRADDEAEVAGRQRALVDLGLGCGAGDGADRVRGRDVVGLADEGEDRAGHVGERHQPVLDHEAAGDHPVVDAELLDDLGQRRPRPGDPAVGLEEAPLALLRQQRLAVVQLQQELDPLAQRLAGVHQPEAGAARPGRQRGAGEDAVGEEGGAAGQHLLRHAEGERAAGVDGRAEDDDAGDRLRAPVGGGLVGEHAALAVAADVDVAADLGGDDVDRLGDGEHVVGERALEPALLLLGSAEVDDPGLDPVRVAGSSRRCWSERRRRSRPPASSAARARSPGTSGRLPSLRPGG